MTGNGSSVQLTETEKAEAASYSTVVAGASVGTALTSVGSTLSAGASAQSMFASVGQTQMLMILPETGGYIPPTVHKTFTNLDNMMFSLDFLSLDTTSLYGGFKGAFHSPKQNSTRNLDIIESGSSFMNLLNFLFILSLVLLFHL